MTTEARYPWYLRQWAIGLFLLVAAVVVMAAVVGSYAWKRQSAIASITKSEGSVVFDAPPAWLPASLAEYWPQWLLSVDAVVTGAGQGSALGLLRELPEIRQLDLSHTPISDVDLSFLASLTRLDALYLEGTAVSDAGLAPLADCRSLHRLFLARTAVGDAGVEHLAGLPLESLDLSHTRVTDAAIGTIAGLHRLESLTLDGTVVGDRGLAKLKGTGLSILGLADTKVTDAGIVSLEIMREIQCLELDRTAVGDKSLTALAKWPRLDMLGLSHTKITDAGLKQLAKLPLRALDLSGTAVTDAGLQTLFTRNTWTWVDVSDTRVTPAAAEKFAEPLQLFVDKNQRPGQLTITRSPGARPTRWVARGAPPASPRGAAAEAEAPRPGGEESQDAPRP